MIYHLLQAFFRQPPALTPLEVYAADPYELHFYLYKHLDESGRKEYYVIIEGLGVARPLSYVVNRLEESMPVTVLGWRVLLDMQQKYGEYISTEQAEAEERAVILYGSPETEAPASPPYALLKVSVTTVR